jgi:hypothetical protein
MRNHAGVAAWIRTVEPAKKVVPRVPKWPSRPCSVTCCVERSTTRPSSTSLRAVTRAPRRIWLVNSTGKATAREISHLRLENVGIFVRTTSPRDQGRFCSGLTPQRRGGQPCRAPVVTALAVNPLRFRRAASVFWSHHSRGSRISMPSAKNTNPPSWCKRPVRKLGLTCTASRVSVEMRIPFLMTKTGTAATSNIARRQFVRRNRCPASKHVISNACVERMPLHSLATSIVT